VIIFRNRSSVCWVFILLIACLPLSTRAELAIEPTPNVKALTSNYPDHWMFIHDLNFASMVAGRVVIIDPAAASRQYKGAIGAGQMATFRPSRSRPELYVAESFYARGIDGARTDVLTIYDTATLDKTGEIVLPGGKRGQFVTQKASFVLTGDDRFGLIFNFTPAASVTVVDLIGRKVVGETPVIRKVLGAIPMPGCAFMYPTGMHGFTSLCGNGGLVSFVLDAKGKVVERKVSAPFNDIDHDAMFMKTAVIDGVAYFPTFTGHVRPIDLSGKFAKILDAWSLVSKAERKKNWRPGGWQLITSDGHGRFYVLMQKNGKEGSHKNGGGEVWVFDPKSRSRVARIPLKSWGISIEATKSTPSYLVVVNADMNLDVYDAGTGHWLRQIGGGLADSPYALYSVE